MWTIIVPADPVIEVWPKNKPTPCEIPLEDGKTYVLFTSRLYPIHVIEGLGLGNSEVTRINTIRPPMDPIQLSQAEITSILLRQILKTYGDWPPEGFELSASEITSINLRQILKTYGDWPPEGLDLMPAEVTSVLLESKLVTYLNWPEEGIELGVAEVTSISLVTP